MPKQRTPARPTRVDPIVDELETWRARAIPDADAPLDADDVARLVRDCLASLGIDDEVTRDFSVNTVHYYRRKDILDEPDGRTSAARYGVRHVWQAAGARLAGFLGLVTLAEARDAMRGADERVVRAFVAARVADARGRQAARAENSAALGASEAPRPLREAARTVAAISSTAAHDAPTAPPFTATVISLGGDAVCLVPSRHAALRSPVAARALVAALAAALGIEP
jgi:hypothetical protein